MYTVQVLVACISSRHPPFRCLAKREDSCSVVSRWNLGHPKRRVAQGLAIVEVNGFKTMQEMLREVHHSDCLESRHASANVLSIACEFSSLPSEKAVFMFVSKLENMAWRGKRKR